MNLWKNKPKTKNKEKLLLRKGVYPCDYVNSYKRLLEKSLPPKEEFYSQLIQIGILDEYYNHAQKNLEKMFKCTTMKKYHDIYLKSNVLILAVVFENFGKVCFENCKLDPSWYYTSPG